MPDAMSQEILSNSNICPYFQTEFSGRFSELQKMPS
jgi:hypothetical protein